MSRSTREASPNLIVFALWLLVFAASSQVMIIAPILPLIGEELSITDAVLGTLVSAYSLMVGVFAVISGPISDRIGRRRILLIGTGVMTVALMLHGLVVGYYSFLIVRVLAGMAGGVLSGSAVSYIGDFFPYNRRGWATGWVMSGSAFGQIIGIPLGVVLADQYGVRSPFYAFAVMMALTYALIFFRVPQPGVRRSRSLSLSTAVSNYAAMLKRSQVAAAALAFFLMFLGLSLYVVYLPTWLESAKGATSNEIALLFLVGGLANVITGPQAGKLSDRIGRKSIVLVSCVGLSIVMFSTTFVLTDLWIAYPLFFMVMVLMAMRISPFSALLTALVSGRLRGSLLSLTVALGQVGFAIGAGMAGPLYDRYGYLSNTVIAAVSVLAMGWVVWLRVPEPAHDGAIKPAAAPI